MKLQNDLFLRAAKGEKTERPPVWLMRQAGRILPQYRALRASLSGFKELVTSPALAAEVTIQPIDELGMDAAIIFSDILVIPEAMGLDYEMIPGKGPVFPSPLTSSKAILDLEFGSAAAAKLTYVYEAVQITKKELNGRVPLIGFCGAPWTILSYMVEGGGSKTFSKAKKFLYQYPQDAHVLLQKITDTSIFYLKNKINAGVDLVQIFDSWAGILSPAQFLEFGLPYIRQMCDAIHEVPITVFAKGAWFGLDKMGKLDCDVIGVDWNTYPSIARHLVGPDKVLQGNLDPCMLYSSPEKIQKATLEMIEKFGGQHIVNLGHGVYPDTPLDNVRVFVDTVKNYAYPQ